jgi:hypothetical protein
MILFLLVIVEVCNDEIVNICNTALVALNSHTLVATTVTTVIEALVGFILVGGVILTINSNLFKLCHKILTS